METLGPRGTCRMCSSTHAALAGARYLAAGSHARRPSGHVGDAVCLSRFLGQTFGDSGKVYLALIWLLPA